MASNQKIAFVANTSWSIYKFRLYLIEKLIEKGFVLFVLAPRDSYTVHFEHIPGLTYLELGHFRGTSIDPFQDALLYKELLQHYRSLQPELIFHYTIKANIFGTMAAARAGIPAVSVVTGLGYTFTGKGWLQSAVKVLYKKVLRRNAETWFLNEDDRRIFIEERLTDPARTFVLPGEGVDSNAFFAAPFGSSPGPANPNPDPANPNPSPDPGRQDIVFLLIGRIIRHKGIYEFVRAAELLQQQGLSVRCQLLGFFDDNNPVAISRREVAEWGRRGLLTYLGHTDDVTPFIQRADCIVLPSYREGMPLSLLEGASMCKALIAADTAGCRTLIEEGVNGYLCREKDGADLAKKMAAYYHLPAAAKRQMGVSARAKVLANFTRERIAAIYLEKIDSLTAARHERTTARHEQ
jgi:glycosyltransferase involved in cell wall biosynthesis